MVPSMRRFFGWLLLIIPILGTIVRLVLDNIGRAHDARWLFEQAGPVMDLIAEQPAAWFYGILLLLAFIGVSLHIPSNTWVRVVQWAHGYEREEILPGLSVVMAVRIPTQGVTRRKYLASFKSADSQAEASIYVSGDNRLIFSVIDRFGEPHNVSAPIDSNKIKFNEFNIIYAGMGKTQTYSVFSFWLNGERIAYETLGFPIQADGLAAGQAKVGADLEGGSNANFDLGTFLYIERTLNNREILQSTEWAKSKIRRGFASFRDGAFLETEARKGLKKEDQE